MDLPDFLETGMDLAEEEEDEDDLLLRAAVQEEEAKYLQHQQQQQQPQDQGILDFPLRTENFQHFLPNHPPQQRSPLIGDGRYLRKRSLRETLFGEIWLGQHLESQRLVVIKQYRKEMVFQRKDRYGRPLAEDPEKELTIHAFLSRFRHPFVVEMFDVCEDHHFLYSVQEFCAGGDFFGLAQRQSFCFQPMVGRHYFLQLCQGVKFLHEIGVAHCDLALENLLQSDQKVLKICDFGAAIRLSPRQDKRIRHEKQQHIAGRLQYFAPEILSGAFYDPRKRDVWAIGIILFAITIGRFPFQAPVLEDRSFRALSADPQRFLRNAFQITGKFRRRQSSSPSDERGGDGWMGPGFTEEELRLNALCCDLLGKLLVKEEHRLLLPEILEHPYCAELITPPREEEKEKQRHVQRWSGDHPFHI